MAEIVNLRLARKRQARAERESAAAARRAEHGVPKAARALADAGRDKAARDLDGHALGKRTPDD